MKINYNMENLLYILITVALQKVSPSARSQSLKNSNCKSLQITYLIPYFTENGGKYQNYTLKTKLIKM